jgi:hypothetical protein
MIKTLHLLTGAALVCSLTFYSWVLYRKDLDRFLLKSLKKNGRVDQGQAKVTFIFEFRNEADAECFKKIEGSTATVIVGASPGFHCEVSRIVPATAMGIKKERLVLSILALRTRGVFFGIR